jgi:hypothetical protein
VTARSEPVPGADRILSNVHDELMRGVTNVKNLGSGGGGTECDHLASGGMSS